MILEQQLASEMEETVKAIRSMSGCYDVELLWNKRSKRWVVVQRANAAKFQVDPLVIDCLPNPDNPPERTDIRALFEFKSPSGGYMNPALHPVTIARMVRERAVRRDEADKMVRDGQKAERDQIARDREEMRAEFEKDCEWALHRERGNRVISTNPDARIRADKPKAPKTVIYTGG